MSAVHSSFSCLLIVCELLSRSTSTRHIISLVFHQREFVDHIAFSSVLFTLSGAPFPGSRWNLLNLLITSWLFRPRPEFFLRVLSVADTVISEIMSIEWKNLSRFYKRYFNAISRGNGSRWGAILGRNRAIKSPYDRPRQHETPHCRTIHVSQSISLSLKRNGRVQQGKRILAGKCRACRDRCRFFPFFLRPSSPSRSSRRSQSLLRKSL